MENTIFKLKLKKVFSGRCWNHPPWTTRCDFPARPSLSGRPRWAGLSISSVTTRRHSRPAALRPPRQNPSPYRHWQHYAINTGCAAQLLLYPQPSCKTLPNREQRSLHLVRQAPKALASRARAFYPQPARSWTRGRSKLMTTMCGTLHFFISPVFCSKPLQHIGIRVQIKPYMGWLNLAALY